MKYDGEDEDKWIKEQKLCSYEEQAREQNRG
jgi:hypothetical protein